MTQKEAVEQTLERFGGILHQQIHDGHEPSSWWVQSYDQDDWYSNSLRQHYSRNIRQTELHYLYILQENPEHSFHYGSIWNCMRKQDVPLFHLWASQKPVLFQNIILSSLWLLLQKKNTELLKASRCISFSIIARRPVTPLRSFLHQVKAKFYHRVVRRFALGGI